MHLSSCINEIEFPCMMKNVFPFSCIENICKVNFAEFRSLGGNTGISEGKFSLICKQIMTLILKLKRSSICFYSPEGTTSISKW